MIDCLLWVAVGLLSFRFMSFLTVDAIISNQAFRHKLDLKQLTFQLLNQLKLGSE